LLSAIDLVEHRRCNGSSGEQQREGQNCVPVPP
jgi:hypothetical protein